MILARKGDWVEIQNVVPKLGQSVKTTAYGQKEEPLVQWVRGFMTTNEASIGDEIEVETIMGRNAKGCLCAINPRYVYDFGDPIKELIQVKMELEKEIEESKDGK